MSLERAVRYPFQYGIILANAPRSSGVYALFKGDELLYVGEAESIYTRLLDHLEQINCVFIPEGPTAFAFESCSAEERKARLIDLVFKWRPPYTERPELKVREE